MIAVGLVITHVMEGVKVVVKMIAHPPVKGIVQELVEIPVRAACGVETLIIGF